MIYAYSVLFILRRVRFFKCTFQCTVFLLVTNQIKLSNILNAGGNKLQTTVRMEEPRAEAKVEASKAATPSSCTQDPKAEALDSLSTSALAALQSDVQPVGHDYVEEVSFVRP